MTRAPHRNNPRVAWTPEMDARLLAMVAEDKNDHEIAKALGVSYVAAGHRRRRIGKGITRPAYRPWTPADDDTLRRLFEDGWTDKKIAKRLERSEHGTYSRRHVLGITQPRVVDLDAKPHPGEAQHVEACRSAGGFPVQDVPKWPLCRALATGGLVPLPGGWQ